MTKLSQMVGVSVCAMVLALGLSVSAAETGVGRTVGKVFESGQAIGSVTDAAHITPSIGGYGAAQQVNAYTGVAVDAADGVANILSGSANSANIGNTMLGAGKWTGNSGMAGIGSMVKNFKNFNSLSDLTNLKNLSTVGQALIKDMTPELKQLMGMNFDGFGLDSLFGGIGGGGYPSQVTDSQAQETKNVASAERDRAVSAEKLTEETENTASRGEAGPMDERLQGGASPSGTTASTGVTPSTGTTPSAGGGGDEQMISPAGDILNSSAGTMAALEKPSINMPEAGITDEIFDDPEKAVKIIKKAFFLPESEEEQRKITADELEKISHNRRVFLSQISSYAISLGKLVEGNIEKFNERRNNAIKFVEEAQNNREAIQVMNGITMGQLSETEKLLGMNTTFMILQLSDTLAQPETLGNDELTTTSE